MDTSALEQAILGMTPADLTALRDGLAQIVGEHEAREAEKARVLTSWKADPNTWFTAAESELLREAQDDLAD